MKKPTKRGGTKRRSTAKRSAERKSSPSKRSPRKRKATSSVAGSVMQTLDGWMSDILSIQRSWMKLPAEIQRNHPGLTQWFGRAKSGSDR